MIAASKRKPVAEDLLSRLDAIADGDAPLSGLGQIRFAAQHLKTTSPDEYLMVIGLADAAEGNYEGFLKSFTEAIERFGPTKELVLNGYMGLTELGRQEEAIEFLTSMSKDLRGNDALEVIANWFARTGHYSLMRATLERLKRETGEDYLILLHDADSALDAMGIVEADLAAASRELAHCMQARGFKRFSSIFRFTDPRVEDPALVIRVEIKKSAEELFALEEEINNAMIAAKLPAVEAGAFQWYLAPLRIQGEALRHVG